MAWNPLDLDRAPEGVQSEAEIGRLKSVFFESSGSEGLSVQIMMTVSGSQLESSIQFSAAANASLSSSKDELIALPLMLALCKTSGSAGLPLVTTSSAPPYLVPAVAEPSV